MTSVNKKTLGKYYLISFILIAVIISIVLYKVINDMNKEETYYSTRYTKPALKYFSIVVGSYIIETGTFPSQTKDVIIWAKNEDILPDAFRLDKENYVLDGFQNRIQITRTDPNQYLLRSFGPNGLDNKGQLDDITLSDIEIFPDSLEPSGNSIPPCLN